MEMTRERAAQDRYRCLRAMHTLAQMMNDEGFYYGHWTLIIPDGADDEELFAIAADEEDIDTFNDAVACFANHFDTYIKEGGLYVGGQVFPSKAKEVAQ